MWQSIIWWINKLNPLKLIEHMRTEWYERKEARELFDILEALGPPADLREPPPDLYDKIMQQIKSEKTP
jgi:hypothetical protein